VGGPPTSGIASLVDIIEEANDSFEHRPAYLVRPLAMADLRREEVRRLRHACRSVSEAIRSIRAVRTGLGSGPGYLECRKGDSLSLPDSVEASVFEAVRPLDRAIADCLSERLAEAREALAFAKAAINDREWADATKDLDRCLLALEDVERRLHRELPAPLGWLRASLR